MNTAWNLWERLALFAYCSAFFFICGIMLMFIVNFIAAGIEKFRWRRYEGRLKAWNKMVKRNEK